MQVKGSTMHACVVTHYKQRPSTWLCKDDTIKAQYTNIMCVCSYIHNTMAKFHMPLGDTLYGYRQYNILIRNGYRDKSTSQGKPMSSRLNIRYVSSVHRLIAQCIHSFLSS